MINTGDRIFSDVGGGSSGGSVTTVYSGTAAGTNTYTVTLTGVSSYTTFLTVQIKFTNGNTAASTLNVNGLGAIPLKNFGNAALNSGDIKAGQILDLVYDGTNFQIKSVTDNIVNAV